MPFTVSHFNFPGMRYAVAKAQNSNLVTVAGVQSQMYKKNVTKLPYFNANLGVGSRRPITQAIKIQIIFSPRTMTSLV